ncbi:MAG TPA: 3-methyl-2-oxobutanoate hydroxymethyltransferase, partial [Burkholderiales bacterium]|nr:3-methyl-2-oxobutanoate hydroxymethyltransferase [Burkholderiales bacterium]
MRITLSTLHKMAQEGNRITQLTCYDASFAAVLEAAGVETLLIGDSLGNVLQGHETTLPVTLRDIVYHVSCVARGSKRAFIIGDMPFGTFQLSPQDTFRNAAEIMAAGAHMVKLEGG